MNYPSPKMNKGDVPPMSTPNSQAQASPRHFTFSKSTHTWVKACKYATTTLTDQQWKTIKYVFWEPKFHFERSKIWELI